MKIRNKIMLGVLSVALLVGGATAATANPLPGLDCRSVYSGGGWISFCTDASGTAGAPTVERISGTDRYQTSALLSQTSFEPGVAEVYIANGQTLADALGAGAAAQGNGPVLLVPQSGTLPAPVATELARLDPAAIIVVGSSASVSDDMLQQVTAAANK